VSTGIVWIGEDAEPAPLIADAARVLEREYSTRVAHLTLDGRPTGTLDVSRGQHSSRTMLAWLAERQPTSCVKLLGVTDVDLFIPVLTFVFGEAQLGGGASVVSIARLRDPDRRRFTHRLVKEAVHEIGHTFGLVHCSSPSCVMSRSPGLASVDSKDERLCGNCRIRYRELTEHSHGPGQVPHSHR
jgi:archaemetzincin